MDNDEHQNLSDHHLVEQRKKDFFNKIRNSPKILGYAILAVIVYIATFIRTRNVDNLRDVTTGGWTLGPDLDPFLFLRYAEYIVENGKLFTHDIMRNVPLGFDTSRELVLHSYMMAWFHKIALIFGSTSIEQSAALFPVFMFALTVIAFFFWARETFLKSLGLKKATYIALIASFFLSVLPPLLPRTIAGIPEKEASGFFFLFLTFFLVTKIWNSPTKKKEYLFALATGISTALMGLVWGGYVYVLVTMAVATTVAFLIGKIDRQKTISYLIWLISAVGIFLISSDRFTLGSLLASTTSGLAFGVAGLLIIHQLILHTKLKQYTRNKYLNSLPPEVKSLVIMIVLGIILSTIFFGFGFIPSKVENVIQTLVRPTADRVGVTVAENRQPYFTEWGQTFGPQIQGIPIFFWLFFTGSAYLFYNITSVLRRKDRIASTLAYVFFLIAVIFSRYNSNSKLNGTNATSLLLYSAGFIALIFVIGKIYYKYYKEQDSNVFKKIDFNLILLFSFFFLSIVSARGAVRLIMVLVPSTSIIVAYLVVQSTHSTLRKQGETEKIIAWALTIIILLAAITAGYQYYKSTSGTAQGYAPSQYTQQWQKAMSWVRDNTQTNAVFGHWWDYGYWVQSLGKRATVLDGGNAIIYWNHFMGRHALTGSDNQKALEFLYTHNTTHFLIDSSDIGKYGAFSSIGSDANFDRYSFIASFGRQNQQTIETKNSTRFVYSGGIGLDQDIIFYNNEGQQVFLPGGKAGLGGIILEKDKAGLISTNPIGIYVYQGKQYNLPLRYAYSAEQGFMDFNSGVESGIFLYPRAVQQQSGSVVIEQDGALMYLSNRTVKSQLARLYLYKENNQNFELVHTEDDFVVEQLKAQFGLTRDFVDFRGLRGPIRIWEITYPENIQANPLFLEIHTPKELTTTRDQVGL